MNLFTMHPNNKRDAFRHWKTQTLITGLRQDGLTAPLIIQRAMTRAILDVYVEKQLSTTLQPGEVFILDSHSLKSKKGQDHPVRP